MPTISPEVEKMLDTITFYIRFYAPGCPTWEKHYALLDDDHKRTHDFLVKCVYEGLEELPNAIERGDPNEIVEKACCLGFSFAAINDVLSTFARPDIESIFAMVEGQMKNAERSFRGALGTLQKARELSC